MAKQKHVLNVKARATKGTADARRLRKTGMIPAVIYSKGKESKSISVPATEWNAISRFEINIVSLMEDGKETLALLKEVQHNFIGSGALHLDFQEIDRNEKVTAKIAIRAGFEAPIGATYGGMLEQNLHELEVSALPQNMPEVVEVDVSKLNVGDLLKVSDVKLPEGVSAVTDPEIVVFSVFDANAAAEAAEAAEAASGETEGAAEPEVIGEKERAEKAAAAEAEKNKK